MAAPKKRQRRRNYDWVQVERDFREANAATGISLGAWCKANSINHNTARKHIRTPDLEIDLKGDLMGGISEQEQEVTEQEQVILKQPMVSLNGGSVVSPFVPGHRLAEKHGGYSEIINAEHFAKALEIPLNSLDAEIVFMRSKLFQVAESKERIEEKIKETTAEGNAELAAIWLEMLTKTDEAEEKITARIESLQRTATSNASTAYLDPLKANKLIASTAKDRAQTDAALVMVDEKRKKLERDEKGGNVVYEIDW